jgi:parallel beta-helix repeat protein
MDTERDAMTRLGWAAAGFALAICFTSPAFAAVISITQAKADAGNVAPGDSAGLPVQLKVSGSYRLDSNLAVSANNKMAIFVTAPNVTIDLNGFTIGGATKGTYGINSSKGGLTVRNGTIRAFKLDAIYASGPTLVVENMRIENNGRYGINELYVNASPKTGLEDGQTLIKNSIVFHNLQGITCQSACHVEGNVISHNSYSGIIISQSGATVINNTVSNNGGYGVVGNYVGLGGNTLFNNIYCHTSGVMLVMEKNAIYPASSGTYCTALPGN